MRFSRGAYAAGQYAQQMFYDQTMGQVIPADVAAAQQWAAADDTQVRDRVQSCRSSFREGRITHAFSATPQGFQGHGFPGQNQQ